MTQPAPVCIATATAACRLIIRPTTAGHPVAWPMLVADPCPFTHATFHGQGHAHIHYMTDPGPVWLRHAPCNRRPYLLTLIPLTAPSVASQPPVRRYGTPGPVSALMAAGRKVAWNWVTGRYTLDGQPATANTLAAAAAELPPPARGWAIDPRAITGPCPHCGGPTAGGSCLKCRWAAALSGTG
jgi:hypothetical protein